MKAIDEGRRIVNNIPLAVQCLLMSGDTPQLNWGGLHYHEYIELLYTVKGDYEVSLNGEIYTFPENSMFIINSGEPHSTFAPSKEHTLFCIKFLPQVLYSSEQSVSELEQTVPYVFENLGLQRMFPKEQLCDTFVPSAFENIIKENSEQRFGYELAIRSDVLKIFAWIIRFWQETSGQGIPQSNSTSLAVMTKAKDYVNQNLADVTLNDVADVCNLSYSHFSRIFKSATNMNFTDYVNLARVNESMKLLCTTDRSITDIALTVGFSSTSYYIYIFKKLKNISPNKFRKMLM